MDHEINLLEKIATVRRYKDGYDLCFVQVSYDNRPRIDLRYIGPAGQVGIGISLDEVDLDDLLQALKKTIIWTEAAENLAF